jgi:hypothetical protein
VSTFIFARGEAREQDMSTKVSAFGNENGTVQCLSREARKQRELYTVDGAS